MKTFITIFALAIFSLSATAQKRVTTEEARHELAVAMIKFVDVISPAYYPKMTQAEFRAKLLGKSSKAMPEGEALINTAFNFLQSKTTAAEIEGKYSGVEIAAAFSKVIELQQTDPKADGTQLFGDTKSLPATSFDKNLGGGCRWYQVGCWLQPVFDFIMDNSVIICALLAVVHVPCPLP